MIYNYGVTDILRVIDGDTVDLQLDLGFYMRTALRFRLLAVDTPERGEPGWAECREYTAHWLDMHFGDGIRAETKKTDSFGRWLAFLYVPPRVDVVEFPAVHLSTDLTSYMRDNGWGRPLNPRWDTTL